MSDLTEFLLARIAEDEERLVHEFDCDRFEVYNYGTRRGDCDCDATPRLLAKCAADRQIVAWADRYEEAVTDYPALPRLDGARNAAVMALRFLALPYADRQDYRQEWKP